MSTENKKRRALWILDHYAITPDMPGGTRYYEIARNLVGRGYDITILASSFHHMTHQELRLKPGEPWKVEEVNGVRFVWLRTFPYQSNNWRRAVNMLTYMVRSFRYGRRLPSLDSSIPRPDIILGRTVHPLAVLSAYWLAKRFRARFLMEVGDLWPQAIVEMGKISAGHPIAKILSLLNHFLCRRAERIVVLSRTIRDSVLEQGVPESKIVLIPNGVDLSRFAEHPTAVGSRERFTVMYLGGHSPFHGLDTVVNAAGILRDKGETRARFVLVGDGPEKPHLMKLAKDLDLKNLVFRDPVPKADVPNVLYEADVFVVCVEPAFATYGGSINKLFDYMAAGKPILLSGTLDDNIIEEAGCGLSLPPNNPEALAEGVIRMFEMTEEERQAMGERGWQYVKERYDWSLLAEKLHQCLESLT